MNTPFTKTVSALLLGLLLLALATTVNGAAQVEHATLDQADFKAAFTEFITRGPGFTADNIDIDNFSCTPCPLQVLSGVVEYVISSQTGGAKLGRTTITTEVLVDGVSQGRVKMSGDLHLYGEVVSAAQSLQRHTILAPDHLVTTRRDLTMLGPDLVTSVDLAIGSELKTTLRPGAVLYKRFIKRPTLVKRGDVVSILAQTNQLTVRVPGRVESPGAKDDLVRVKNLMSRKEIYARVITSEEVQVDF